MYSKETNKNTNEVIIDGVDVAERKKKLNEIVIRKDFAKVIVKVKSTELKKYL